MNVYLVLAAMVAFGIVQIVVVIIAGICAAIRLIAYRIEHPEYQDRRAQYTAAGVMAVLSWALYWVMLVWLIRIYA